MPNFEQPPVCYLINPAEVEAVCHYYKPTKTCTYTYMKYRIRKAFFKYETKVILAELWRASAKEGECVNNTVIQELQGTDGETNKKTHLQFATSYSTATSGGSIMSLGMALFRRDMEGK